VHLPWCERKCPYCDFNSHETSNLPETAYIEALLADLRSQAAWAQGRPVTTVFIGGGTPSLFSVPAISRLMTGIAEIVALAPDLEVTMEANPGSAEAKKFAGFRRAGINRLSLGVQSFGDDKLLALGRVHDSRQARAAIEMIRAAGFTNFNIDLMHGLPGQSPEDAVADLENALAFEPPHLSWYQLTVEPNTAFYKRPPTLPLEDCLADIQDRGEQLLARSGYRQYEVSAYSRPGHQCRHNLNYWRFGDYLAIGAGAHGKLTGRDGAVRRYRKKRQPLEYLSGRAGRRAHWQLLRRPELRGEFILNALRLNEGFSLSHFESRTGLSAAALQPQLELSLHRGLLRQRGDRVTTTELGGRFLDTVVSEFLPD
jgi:oxygen-independent coproporphyrinogen-3 oxidase